jgi:hypothetical protein
MGDEFRVNVTALRSTAGQMNEHASKVESHGDALKAGTAVRVGRGALGEAIEAAVRRGLLLFIHDTTLIVKGFIQDTATGLTRVARRTADDDEGARRAFDDLARGRHRDESGGPGVSVRLSPTRWGGNTLDNWRSQRYQFGDHQYLLDRSDLTHILERHHPDYWKGEMKKRQTFLPKGMSIEDVQNAIASVLNQNRGELAERGPIGYHTMRGEVDGIEYVLGISNGHIGQFYPVYPQ